MLLDSRRVVSAVNDQGVSRVALEQEDVLATFVVVESVEEIVRGVLLCQKHS